MSNENLSTFRKFVMEYGSILGLCWTAVFACYVIGFRTQSGLSMLLGICGLIALLSLEFYLGIRMKKRSLQLSIPFTFLFSLINTVSMFMYACLLSGCMQFIYFAHIDKGNLFSSINAMLTSSDIQNTYRQAGLSAYYTQIIDMIHELELLSAFDKTLLLFNNNFLTSLILSLPIAVTAYYYKPAILK